MAKKKKRKLGYKEWVGYYLAKRTETGGIAINTKKNFKQGHTHVRDIHCAYWLCKMAYYKIIPKRSSQRNLQSLIRISDDKEYKEKVQQLYEVRKQKGKKQNYYNANIVPK